jgi:hypothetical protein
MWELKAMESLDAIREAGAVGMASGHKPAMKI